MHSSNASITDEVLRPGAVPLWEVPGWFERFGLTAGVTGRGAGQDPFDLGLGTDRPVGEVMERWRAFRAAFPGFPSQILSRQVHGTRVAWHRRSPPGWLLLDGFDGHATASAGRLLLVTVADCVPVYLAAPRHGAAALLHAGWRGVAGGIVAAGVNLLAERTGAGPAEMILHAGIAISGPQYPVGREVLAALGIGAAAAGPGPWTVDLRALIAAQAEQLGIGVVSMSGHCTARDGERFFSHRRSAGRDGRMVAWLGIVPRWPPRADAG